MSAIAGFHFNAKGRHFIFGPGFISKPSFFMLFFKDWISSNIQSLKSGG